MGTHCQDYEICGFYVFLSQSVMSVLSAYRHAQTLQRISSDHINKLKKLSKVFYILNPTQKVLADIYKVYKVWNMKSVCIIPKLKN